MNADTKAKSYVGTFLTNLFIQVCTVLQGILLARILGPDGRGEYAAIILWPTIFAGLGLFGVDMSIARQVGKSDDPKLFVMVALFSALVTAGATAILCGFSLSYLVPENLHNLLPLAYFFILFIPINHIMMNLQGIDLGAGHFTLLNISRASLYPIYLLGIALSWFSEHNKIYWCVVALIFSNAFAVLVRCYYYEKIPFIGFWKLKFGRIFIDSFPFFCANVLAILYQQIDKMLLVWLLPIREIGYYTVALSAGSALSALNQALGAVTFSDATRQAYRTGFPALAQTIRRGAILSVIGAVVLAITLPLLFPLVYGHEFVGAVPLALLLLPSVTISSLSGIINQGLRGQGRPIVGIVARALGLLMIAFIGSFLALRMGAIGIAWGLIAGEAVSFAGMLLVAMRFYSDSDIKYLAPRQEDLIFVRQKLVIFIHKYFFSSKL